MIQVKTYEIKLRLEYDYDDSLVDEWIDNGDEELVYLNIDLTSEMIGEWLSKQGFYVEVDYKDKTKEETK
jgi:hypothetical protein